MNPNSPPPYPSSLLSSSYPSAGTSSLRGAAGNGSGTTYTHSPYGRISQETPLHRDSGALSSPPEGIEPLRLGTTTTSATTPNVNARYRIQSPLVKVVEQRCVQFPTSPQVGPQRSPRYSSRSNSMCGGTNSESGLAPPQLQFAPHINSPTYAATYTSSHFSPPPAIGNAKGSSMSISIPISVPHPSQSSPASMASSPTGAGSHALMASTIVAQPPSGGLMGSPMGTHGLLPGSLAGYLAAPPSYNRGGSLSSSHHGPPPTYVSSVPTDRGFRKIPPTRTRAASSTELSVSHSHSSLIQSANAGHSEFPVGLSGGVAPSIEGSAPVNGRQRSTTFSPAAGMFNPYGSPPTATMGPPDYDTYHSKVPNAVVAVTASLPSATAANPDATTAASPTDEVSSLQSGSSASSIREDLALCPNDDACPLINDRRHQRRYSHTCRLFPCYHGHIRRHAKLFRHCQGQVTATECTLASVTESGSVRKTKLSTQALTSVNFAFISPEAPNAVRIYVAHKDRRYEIYGDWASVKVHTLKRYLHQVFNVQPRSQVLCLVVGAQPPCATSHKDPACESDTLCRSGIVLSPERALSSNADGAVAEDETPGHRGEAEETSRSNVASGGELQATPIAKVDRREDSHRSKASSTGIPLDLDVVGEGGGGPDGEIPGSLKVMDDELRTVASYGVCGGSQLSLKVKEEMGMRKISLDDL